METRTRTGRPIGTTVAAVAMGAIGGLILFFGIGLFFQHLFPVGIPEGLTLSEYREMPVLVILAGAVLVELAVFVNAMGQQHAKVT